MKAGRREQKEKFANMFVAPDTCDYCGLAVEDGKLRRCSKCLFARYCSPECQREAWSQGCKGELRYGALAQRPHKRVCYDVKTYEFAVLVEKA